MPRLLIVHHTPSPHTQEMFEAVVAGATDPEIESVEVVRRPALTVSPVEMLEADGYCGSGLGGWFFFFFWVWGCELRWCFATGASAGRRATGGHRPCP